MVTESNFFIMNPLKNVTSHPKIRKNESMSAKSVLSMLDRLAGIEIHDVIFGAISDEFGEAAPVNNGI